MDKNNSEKCCSSKYFSFVFLMLAFLYTGIFEKVDAAQPQKLINTSIDITDEQVWDGSDILLAANGVIRIDGGNLKISNATISFEAREYASTIAVTNNGTLKLENVNMDCTNLNSSGISVSNNSKLYVDNSEIGNFNLDFLPLIRIIDSELYIVNDSKIFNNTDDRSTNSYRWNFIDITNGKVTIDQAAFYGNKSSGRANAFLVAEGENTEISITNSSFTENIGFYYGIIDVNGIKSLSISDSEFVGNNSDYGGVIYQDGGELTLDNDNFSGNSSQNTGGALFVGNSSVNIRKCSFVQNNSILSEGGAIYSHENKMNVENTVFRENNSKFFGGAVSFSGDDSSVLTINGVEFVENHSGYGAGALMVWSGSAFINKAQFLNNITTGTGGAVSIGDAVVYMKRLAIVENDAADIGGAIFCWLSDKPTKIYSRNGLLLYGNTAGKADEEYQDIWYDNYFDAEDRMFNGGRFNWSEKEGFYEYKHENGKFLGADPSNSYFDEALVVMRGNKVNFEFPDGYGFGFGGAIGIEEGSLIVGEESVSLTGIKTFDDFDDRYGRRPDPLSFAALIQIKDNDEIYELGEPVEIERENLSDGSIRYLFYYQQEGSAAMELFAKPDGSYHFELLNLPKYIDGKEANYELDEKESEYYTAAISGTQIGGFELHNTYIPQERDVKLSLHWVDDHNSKNTRPSIDSLINTLQLFASENLYEIGSRRLTEHWQEGDVDHYQFSVEGEPFLKINLTDRKDDIWEITFVDLPIYVDGRVAEWNFKEELEHYTLYEINGNMDEGFNLYYRLQGEETDRNTMILYKLTDRLQVMPRTGFSALHPTLLEKMPKDLHLSFTGRRLEIPTLSISSDILTVPYLNGDYPVEWLGNSVGLLEGFDLNGTGQSLLVGHNHLSTMEAGPFVMLQWLEDGDLIFITDKYGQLMRYAVYANSLINENDMEVLQKIADNDPRSLTLMTCENESADGRYLNRRVIAAKPLD